ncbi:MAG: transcriptional regulator [Candidatus Rokuibacteriota bacterium]|nr:MAG: transcriptional regulator [Candidatus Rokubacteria bacterium]
MLDELDAGIIRILQRDSRVANTEIARRLAVTEGTVRNRIDRLVRHGVIQFGVWADPLKLGYQNYAIIEIHVNEPDIEKVADRLARFPEIFFLGICTGNFDISAAAVFRSNDHLYQVMTQLRQVPGIERTSTASVIRLVKREYTYPVALEEADGRGSRRRERPHERRPGGARRGRPGPPPAHTMKRP